MHESKNLELHIVDHCNLDCVACSHESPFFPKRFEDPDQLAQSLERLWQCYHTPLLKILGGEPLLHPQINEIIRVVKRLTGARVRVVTNGTHLRRVIKQLVGIDELHISVYPSIRIPTDDDLAIFARELNAPITLQAFSSFRWQHSERLHEAPVTQRVFRTCQLFHRWQCHTLRNGWFYPCPPAATWSADRTEGVNLLSAEVDLPRCLNELLLRREPFASCAECFGSAGLRMAHTRGWRRVNSDSPAQLDSSFLSALEVDPGAHNDCFAYQRTLYPSGEIVQHGFDE